MQTDDEVREYPDPETVLAIRGAIATGRLGGPRGEDGHWLNEFWRIGREMRQLQGFQGNARRDLLDTTSRYLAINEPVFDQVDEASLRGGSVPKA